MPTIYLLAAIPGCACGQCSRRWACTPCSHPWSGRARGTARRSRSTSTWTEQGMMGLNMINDILGKNSVYGKCYFSYFFLLKKIVLIIQYFTLFSSFIFPFFLERRAKRHIFQFFLGKKIVPLLYLSLSTSDHPFLCLTSWTKNVLIPS